MHAFDAATEITPAGTPGRYRAQIDPDWSIDGTPNGGYLLVIAARAAMAEVTDVHEHPIAVTGAFVRRAEFGPADVEVEVLRRGRATSVARVRLSSGGETCLETLVTAGSVDGAQLHPAPPMPAMPAQEQCRRAPVQAGPFQVPLLGPVCERLDPATAGFAVSRPRGAGELRAWVHLDDGREPDLLSLLLFADCLPPPTFDLPSVALGWVPTLQLSVFVRATPAPGPLVLRTVARSVAGGAVDETCDVWDCTGRHVAVAHQLAAVRPAS